MIKQLVVPMLLLVSPPVGAERQSATEPQAVKLHIRVAQCPGDATAGATSLTPVRSAEWVREHVRATQQVLGPYGVRLTAEIDSFEPERCALLTRRHRHQMAHFVEMDGRVTVLVLQRVRDVDVPTYNLMGVHWRYRGDRRAWLGRRWILLTARGKPPVLAHELCHYFGLAHDPRGGNLMTPGPSSPLWQKKRRPAPFSPVLTPTQQGLLRRGVGSFLQSFPRR